MAHQRPWSPPEDPEKPPYPYTPRFACTITEHAPPQPFGRPAYGFGDWPYDLVPEELLESITQTKLVLMCPPLESKAQTASSSTPRKAKLTITKTIAGGDERGAQIVACSINPEELGKQPFVVVAKIFDPLYYSFRNPLSFSQPYDSAFTADSDYSVEAAAYQYLDHIGQTGSVAPEYYGSWTLSLPIVHEGVQRQRNVRLLLIEYLDGICMHGLCNDKSLSLRYHESYRMGVLAKALDGYATLMYLGIEQFDLAPRNVMLVPAPQDIPGPQPIPRTVLIDYNNAVLSDWSEFGRAPYRDKKLPLNPMDVFWHYSLEDFGNWIPLEWNSNPRAKQEWLLEQFGGEKASRYQSPCKMLELDPPPAPRKPPVPR